eukprot:CAMPEP_0184479788 /NCGR_PEP_ID=MMETSP0113_2-20130426/1372_1 /TAXON_ID=91329 /ORGANISM="Norrisiella sphaerica, Strain BC52" /LENGTH=469 /DNA_ID=CAMNT_0026857939 /DNA_START=193 /DNA_END=1599 /DNA_ORIENTATION=-
MGDLMLQIMDLTGVKPAEQKLLLTDPVSRKTSDIGGKDLKLTLANVPLKKGDMLQLIETGSTRAKIASKRQSDKQKAEQSAAQEEKNKKQFHMTFKAFKKISGLPVIPDYLSYLSASSKKRSVSSYAPNVHWKLQRYRHLDVISFADPQVPQVFYRNSTPELKQNLSRIGILFGRYVEDINPLAEQNLTDDLNREKKWDFDANGVRADVFAVYEPPQEAVRNGARFITDPREVVVKGMAEAMGLEPVGLMICKKKAKPDANGFQTYLTGKELLQVAKLQNFFSDENGFSRFGCILLEHSELIEPVGLAASDICTGLERADLLDVVRGQPFRLRTRVPEGADPSMMPQFYIPKENDESGGKNQAKEKISTGDSFPIDFLTVKVIASVPKGNFKLFKHCEFPVNGSMQDLKNYMKRHSNEGFSSKFSDFNLLINLPDFFGEKETETCVTIAKCIGNKEEFPTEVCNKLDQW